MEVLVVADGGEHRERILGYDCCEVVIVIAGEVKFGAAASENQHGIVFQLRFHDCVQGFDYRSRAVFSLHECREKVEFHFESVRVFFYMTHEVAIAGCIFGRYYCESIREIWHQKFLLELHETFFLQSFDGLLTLELLESEREFRVYIIDYQGESVKLAV